MSIEKDPYITENSGPGMIKEEYLYVSGGLVTPLREFSNRFGTPKNIYYPCCGEDTSIASAFPRSNVIFCDIADGNEAFASRGLHFVQKSAKDWIPDIPQDLLFILNPSINIDKPLESVKDEGFVVSNNYHGTAEDIHTSRDFVFLGAFDSDGAFYPPEISEKQFERVQTDREWQSNNPGAFSYTMKYEEARKVVESFGPRIGSVIDNYNNLYHHLSPEDGGLIQLHNETFILSPLPRKWGSVDFLYIFQKKTPTTASGGATR